MKKERLVEMNQRASVLLSKAWVSPAGFDRAPDNPSAQPPTVIIFGPPWPRSGTARVMHIFSWGSQARTFNTTANLCRDEFVEILHGRISHVGAARDFRAFVQRDLAEQQCTAGEYIKAKQSRRLLLQARPYDRATSAKYL